GELPEGPYLSSAVRLDNCVGCRVVVGVPFTDSLVQRLDRGNLNDSLRDLGIVVNGRLVASTGVDVGSAQAIGLGEPSNATVSGIDMRALAVAVPCSGTNDCSLIAMYPRSALNDAIDSQRLRILVPLILVALIV